ncbi:MAG: hypothetical protein LBL57_05155 [Tannerella sp.]|jgi:hypothetical protein|nr:hypothetical protein [Tannerella sp.]
MVVVDGLFLYNHAVELHEVREFERSIAVFKHCMRYMELLCEVYGGKEKIQAMRSPDGTERFCFPLRALHYPPPEQVAGYRIYGFRLPDP